MNKELFSRTKSTKNRFSLLSIILAIVLIIYTISLFALIYWGLITSFKTGDDFVLNWNIGFAFPSSWGPENFEAYRFIFTDFKIVLSDEKSVNFLELFHNSFVYALGCGILQTLIPCCVAYVCSRFKFKFLKIYYYTVIITMIIPVVGSTASEIKMATVLGLYDQLWGLWIMKANFLGFYFLIFYSTFKNIPDAYSEAAKIDGAGNWTIFVKVMLPIVRNTFLTIFLIYFIQFWNDYQVPFLYLKSRPTIFYEIYCIAHGVTTLQELSSVPGYFAFAFIGLIPTVVLFLCFHKKLLGSLTVGGIK